MSEQEFQVPSHVPVALVADFDFLRPEGADRDPFLALKRLHDPPEHEKYRRLLMPAFTPAAVAAWSDQARALAVSLIESFYAKGECEFIADFAQQLPIIIFLRICGLPLEDREMLLGWVNTSLRPGEAAIREPARDKMAAYIRGVVDARRANPGDDLVSRALAADIGGRKLDDMEAFGLVNGLLGGGLDTSPPAWAGWRAFSP